MQHIYIYEISDPKAATQSGTPSLTMFLQVTNDRHVQYFFSYSSHVKLIFPSTWHLADTTFDEAQISVRYKRYGCHRGATYTWLPTSVIYNLISFLLHVMCVPVTITRRVLELRMQEAASIYGGQLRTY
jgi:hypothetical protein